MITSDMRELVPFFAAVFQFEDLGLIMHLWRLIYDVTNVLLRPAR